MSRPFFIYWYDTNAQFYWMRTNQEADILICLSHKQVFSSIINQKSLSLGLIVFPVSLNRRNSKLVNKDNKMANTKSYSIREQVLDKYLQKDWYTCSDLMKFCNEALEEVGYSPMKSRQTFQDDIVAIENRHHIIIEREQRGRVWYYRYKRKNFSIYKPKLDDEDLQCLNQALKVLNTFKGMPQFDWIAELEARFKTSFKSDTNKRSIVAFQDTANNTGMENFTPLFDSIINKTAIDITYKSFRMEKAEIYSISPYSLKQYNNRWFLIGRTIGYNNIGVFPLDRIEDISDSEKTYEESGIDFNEYFANVIGVSIPKGQEAEVIEIWFAKEQLRYVETKPLHNSQRIVQKDDNGGIVELSVIVNYELEQNILSFGEKAKVLSPKHLKDRIKCRITENLKNY